MPSKSAVDFAKAFKEAGGFEGVSYSSLIRFVALMCVILGILWSIVHFLSEDAKATDSFIVKSGSRAVRMVIGLTIIISLLTIT